MTEPKSTTQTSPKRRGRFRTHLSTAVVMMFVAGGIIGANFRECVTAELSANAGGGYDCVLARSHGWPLCLRCAFRPCTPVMAQMGQECLQLGRITLENGQSFGVIETHNYMYSPGWLKPIEGGAALIDFILLAGAVLITAALCECFIRRARSDVVS